MSKLLLTITLGLFVAAILMSNAGCQSPSGSSSSYGSSDGHAGHNH